MSTYIGIDLGTTATKIAAIDSDGRVLARLRVPHPAARRIGAGRVDPRAWHAGLATACAELGPLAKSTTAVGLSVHCPVALLYDTAGEPVTSGLTWDNPAIAQHAARVVAERTPDEARSAANYPAPSTLMIAAHGFFAEAEPDALAAAAELGLIGSWLGRWLTGTSALDPTQASYTGAFATTAVAGSWLGGLLDRLGVDEMLLPTIRPSLSVLGELRAGAASALGLPAGVPVVVGAADTPSASYALGARPGGPPLFIMGTTHVISSCVGQPDPRAVALQRADVRPGQWLLNGVTNGGDALAMSARLLGYGSSAGSVHSLIEDAWGVPMDEVASAPIFIPHVMPERGPLWLSEPRTAMFDLASATTRGSAARGVLEGVFFADRMIIENCVPARRGEVLLSGAFGADVVVPQILADCLDRDIQVLDESHLPAIGAAAMCVETLEGRRIRPSQARRVYPRGSCREIVAERWTHYLERWSTTVGRPALEPFPDTLSGVGHVPIRGVQV